MAPPPSRNQVPLPVSLTLYNLYVDQYDNTFSINTTTTTGEQRTNALLYHRPEYTRDLLVPVRLDVVFSSSSVSNHQQTESDDEILLYSSTLNTCTIHPSWNHLEEQIDAFQESSVDSIYPNMTCKLIALVKNTNDDSEKEVVLATVPLHPSRLRRLPPQDESSFNDNTDTASSLVVAWDKCPPPTRLPPNAVLLTFSDGSTRVCPPLYHFLLSEQVLVETDPRDASLVQDDEEEYKRQLRFDDDVFDTLDQAVWWQEQHNSSGSVAKRDQRPSPSSLLETDDESKAIVIKSLGRNDKDENDDEALADEFESRLVLSGGESGHDGVNRDDPSTTDLTQLSQDNTNSFLPIEVETVVDDLKREKEKLELLLTQEEACLEEEVRALHETEASLKTLMERVQHVETEIMLMRSDAADERRKQEELEFCLEAQRIKLLEELRMIYPIRGQAEETWFIRGQEIPKDLHASGISEEEISAALGFLAHSVVMLAKYLSIPLRYRIVCNSSRSAVQQDATTILPLFQARMVERDELDRAMLLMERNVACILKTRGIPHIEEAHVLQKVNRIYDSIVDGR